MKQAMLWADGNFEARRTVLVNPTPNPSPNPSPPVTLPASREGTCCVPKQREMWPRLADYRFAAPRTAIVDVRHTREFERFVRFLRDKLWLDQYIRRGGHRLEYISFVHGAPQYRIYCRGVVLYVRDADRLAVVQPEVAAYAMAAYGFVPGITYLTKIDPLARKYPREGGWQRGA